MKPSLVAVSLLSCVVCYRIPHALADEGDQERVDFVLEIQPLLSRHCASCHGAEKQESGLRLDAVQGLRRGGDLGAVLDADRPDASRLLLVVTDQDDEVGKMPPEGPGLTDAEIELLARWIKQGAELPEQPAGESRAAQHWSFQPPVRPRPPAVSNPVWPRTAIDHFVLARLDVEGLAPSPPADRATLIRRLSVDLLGLPPTPAEVDAFVDDPRPDAYQRLVECLLASPAYGERWGRHWLDLARYADSNGYTRDFGRSIWKYRDWVIHAINDDMPFDQFTIEQFAGDLLPEATLQQQIATGFHRNTLINEEGGTDAEQFRVDAVADRVATTGVVYLGLTFGCARCHSHKYDPISQREYYQLFAFLNSCDEPQIEAPSDWQIQRGDLARRAEIKAQIKVLEQQLEARRSEFEASQLEWERAITPEFRVTLPGPTQEALMIPLAKRDAAQQKLVEDLYKQSAEARQAFPRVDEIDQLRRSAPSIPTSMVMRERSETRATFVHLRGDFLDKGDRVQPAVPAALHPLPEAVEHPNRLDFASWLIDPANPLTPRVVINRHWQRLFGRGIVDTENDFGTQGGRPTHPKLLDWLACELVDRRWSVKAIHRLIVNSATYRQSSRHRDELTEVDPYNRLLARQARIRLDAEVVRDTALRASGLLCRTIGGPSVHPPQPDGVFAFTQDPKPWNTDQQQDRYRRGMYTFFWRSSPYPALTVFDAPNANVTCTRRVRSNTPLQALTLANDVQFVESARALARRVLQADGASARIEAAFRLCLSRRPTAAERQRVLELLEQQQAEFTTDTEAARQLLADEQPPGSPAESAAWTAVARVLMNLDEFITRE